MVSKKGASCYCQIHRLFVNCLAENTPFPICQIQLPEKLAGWTVSLLVVRLEDIVCKDVFPEPPSEPPSSSLGK